MSPSLDPQFADLLMKMRAFRASSSPKNPEEAVEAARSGLRNAIPLAGTPEPVAHVEDLTLPLRTGPTPVRVYRPGEGPRRTVLYFHGGGFMAGDLDTHDTPLRALANRSGCLLVAVDYRLAPEHPFPAAPEDAHAALVWAAEHAEEIGGDPNDLAVAGDSAGGGLAAAATFLARERGGPAIGRQLLIYPDTDLRASTHSWAEFGDVAAPILDYDGKLFMIGAYLGGVHPTDPLASPLLAEDHAGLPPALVMTGECDPQRDEGEAYAHKLTKAGVAARIRRYPGMTHGFFQMAGVIDAAQSAIDEAAAFLAE